MHTLIQKTVYLEPDMDDWIRDQAKRNGISSSEQFHRCLQTGIAQASQPPEGFEKPTLWTRRDVVLVLRVVQLDGSTEQWLHQRAWKERNYSSRENGWIEVSDCVRWCVGIGIFLQNRNVV